MSDAPMKPGSSFLDRWSRRKRGHADEPDAKPAGARGVRDSAVSPSASDAAVPRDRLPAGGAEDPNPTGTHASAMSIEASLPGVDDLTAESDVTGFLKQGVSEELKRLALRRIWSLDPQIRDFIEVAENQYNWNVPGGAPGYGPIAAGTDLKALLEQATGAVSEKPPECEDVDTDVARRADPVDELETVATDLKGTPPPLAPDRQADTASPRETLGDPAEVGAPAEPERPGRRRHGGALPA